MSDIKIRKKELRKQMLGKRMELSKERFRQKSESLFERVMSLEKLAGSDTIHCYVAMTERGEPDTSEIISELLRLGKRVAVPVMDLASRELTHVKVDETTSWKTNRWGVKEPSAGPLIAAEEFDLVLVPLLAADRHRNRLGYGKGYYDTFLARTSAFKAGLLFSDMLVPEVPVEPHDIPLDVIITETGLI
ncbi:MAG: 5-formyltetrahydrofolate cyclo-ligase [Balneolia bacterium]|nr:5-formyltetrahydrofolate cyclo-ligase [Balneolia bacterium]